MKEIIIATKNKGKVKEFKQLFNQFGIQVKSLLELDTKLPDVEETGTTFAENARLKAEEISALIGKPVLADDSGLSVDALDGRPGVYSARYAGEPTNDVLNYEKVLKEMENVPEKKRSARFICVLAMAVPGEKTIFKKGTCEGIIAMAAKGNNGFGYDPIFIPNGYKKTMAELDETVKNKISHRFNALIQLETWLNEEINAGENDE